MTTSNNTTNRIVAIITLSLLVAAMPLLHVNAANNKNDTDSLPVKIERPVNSAFTFDIGGAQILDTYLTPIKYTGMNMRIGYERMQAMKFSPLHWISQIDAGIDYQKVKNIPRTRTMHSLMLEFQWGMMHRWHIDCLQGLQIMAGGSTRFRGGALYNAANSNNPVSAKLHWSINMQGMAVYNTHIRNLPITLRYEATLPFIGAFFSPEYGQSFYEIYLGDRRNIVHCGWWGNRFDMENLLTFDWHFGSTALRIGYRHNFTTLWAKNISVRKSVHSLVLGVEWESLRIHPVKGLPAKAKMISAMY